MRKIAKPSNGTYQSSTNGNGKSKKVVNFYEQYSDFKMKPFSERSLKDMIQEFIEWCQEDPKAYKAAQYFTLKGFPSKTVWELRQKYDWFDQGYLFGLEILGCRREAGAIERRYSEGMVRYMMHHYDPDWATADKYNAELKKDDIDKAQNIVIEMTTIKEEEK